MSKSKRVETKWELWSYDVWGNAKEGYEVNDRSCFDRNYPIMASLKVYNPGTPQEFSCPEVSNYQIRKAFGITCNFETDGDDETIYINRSKDGYPIGEMIKIND